MQPPSDEVKAKAAKMITRQRIQLLCSTQKSPFFAHLVMRLLLKECPIATMGTDGAYLYYNPNWVVSMEKNEEQLCSALCHEAMHPALGHLWRKGTREHVKFNYACDYVINRILEKNGFILWETPEPLLDKRFDNMSAEEVYALLDDPPEQEGGGQGLGQGQSLDGEGTMDNHDFWNDAGSSKNDDGVENNEQVWKDRLNRAAIAAKMVGKLPADIESLVDALLEPKLDWRELLRNFVHDTTKTNYRMSPPNKRFLHIPLLLSSMQGDFLEIAVAVDTSGSIGKNELEAFVSELKGIADQFENYRIHVYACDAKLHNYTVVETEDEWPKSYGGGGGTNFVPVFEDIAERGLDISVLVYLTDSLGRFPDEAPPYPVLWVVSIPKAEVPFGDKIFLDMND